MCRGNARRRAFSCDSGITVGMDSPTLDLRAVRTWQVRLHEEPRRNAPGGRGGIKDEDIILSVDGTKIEDGQKLTLDLMIAHR